MIKAVLFDLDKTLVERIPTEVDEVYQWCSQMGQPKNKDDIIKSYSKVENWTGFQVQKENETGILMPDDEFERNIQNIYTESLNLTLSSDEIKSLPTIINSRKDKPLTVKTGAIDLLQKLKLLSLKLAVVSNNYTSIKAEINNLCISEHMDEIVISEEIGISKPDKRIMEITAKKLNVSLHECIYIGDHPFDILCAHDAGIKIIFMPISEYIQVPQFIGSPDYRVSNLQEIYSIIEEIL